jgi:hypothetical protein
MSWKRDHNSGEGMKVRGKARAVVCLPSQFGILEEDWWTFYMLLAFEVISIPYRNYATKFYGNVGTFLPFSGIHLLRKSVTMWLCDG